MTDKEGLADALFRDWRFEEDGSPKDPPFVLDRPEMAGRRILLAGDNFGTGSSREHAPWALRAWGIEAILSTSFADIFRSNALKNGVLPIVVDPATHRRLFELLERDPDAELRVDLAEQGILLPDGSTIDFDVDPFARMMLLAGTDEIGYVLGHDDAIAAWEAAHPPRVDTRARRGRRLTPDPAGRARRGTAPAPRAVCGAMTTLRTVPSSTAASVLVALLLVAGCAGAGSTASSTAPPAPARPQTRRTLRRRPRCPARRTRRRHRPGRTTRRSAAARTATRHGRRRRPRPGRSRPARADDRAPIAGLTGVHPVAAAALDTALNGQRPRRAGRVVERRRAVQRARRRRRGRDGDTFMLTVREGSAAAPDTMCIEIAQYKATIVDLGELEPGTYTITAFGDAAPVDDHRRADAHDRRWPAAGLWRLPILRG